MTVYAPPGTGVYYALHKGWTPEMHKLTDLVDIGSWLQWSKSTAAEQSPNSPPKPQWRPGDATPDEEPVGTIRDYMRLVGMEGADDD